MGRSRARWRHSTSSDTGNRLHFPNLPTIGVECLSTRLDGLNDLLQDLYNSEYVREKLVS